VEETHLIAPAFLNTVRVGVNREVAGTLQTAPGANPLGADNNPRPSPRIVRPRDPVAGLTSFQGGLNGTSFGNYWFTTYQAYDDAFLTKGIHSLKFGFALEEDRLQLPASRQSRRCVPVQLSLGLPAQQAGIVPVPIWSADTPRSSPERLRRLRGRRYPPAPQSHGECRPAL